eukprot:TRINITY_DN7546_c0_g1_i2.p1 TRINITY_DN7546_c0_g1~~TRINITY_DN7546_c0_g1_i2.p1  ORF type:complete len:224 (-),score=11.91 TRINITY_DN7546_c0_g1_i2:437-1108(-)
MASSEARNPFRETLNAISLHKRGPNRPTCHTSCWDRLVRDPRRNKGSTPRYYEQNNLYAAPVPLSGSPLHDAVRLSDLPRVRLLVETLKVDPNEANSKGQTPLWIACAEGHLEAARYLVDQAHVDPDQRASAFMLSPMGVACQRGHKNIVSWLSTKVPTSHPIRMREARMHQKMNPRLRPGSTGAARTCPIYGEFSKNQGNHHVSEGPVVLQFEDQLRAAPDQ